MDPTTCFLHILQYAIYTTFSVEQVLSRRMLCFLPVALEITYDRLATKLSHELHFLSHGFY